MEKDEIVSIDVVRTYSNYAIVLLHAWAAQQYVCGGTWEYRLWDFVCNAAMSAVLPALFLISGYLIATKWEECWGTKLWRRVKRLAVPYLVWNITFVAFYLGISKVVPRIGQRVSTFQLDSVSGAVTKVCSLMADPIDMPMWFMRTLLIYAVLTLVLHPLLRHRRGIFAYALILCLFGLSLIFDWGGALKFTYPFYSLLCYTIGINLRIRGRSPFEFFKSKGWMPVACLGMAGLCWYNVRWHWDYSVVRDISFVMMLPLMFILAPMFVRISRHVPMRSFLQRSSFFLYTGHFLFCSCVLHALAPMLGWWHGLGKLTLLIGVFCTLGICVNLSAYWVGKRFLGKAFGCWDGTL